MTPLKRFLQNFFGLSRSEANGLLIFLPIMLLIILSQPMYAWWIANDTKDSTADRAFLDSLTAQWNLQREAKAGALPTEKISETKLHFFDPNLATIAQLKVVGFREPLASRIIHYREKGGKFKIKSDVMKIYGMSHDLYVRISPYVLLPDKLNVPLQNKQPVPQSAKMLKKEIVKFNLNNADTAQLKSIYGIGVKLSERIVKYREKLGGYVTMAQLSEVYGLDTAVINRLGKRAFIEPEFLPKLISINKATEQELSAHPYLKKTAASAIATYRFQHGNFKELNDLRVLHVLSDETIKKIEPYLTFED